MITTRADGTPHFPQSWTENPMTIIGFDFNCLTLIEKEVVQLLNKFKVMSSRMMIILDRGKDRKIDKYLSKFKFMETLI